MDNVDFEDNSEALRLALLRGARFGLEDVLDRTVEYAVRFCPVRDGNLLRAIDRMPVIAHPTYVEGEYGAFEAYAASVEYGSAGEGEPFGGSYVSPTGQNDWPLVPPGKKRFEKYPIRPRPPRQFLRWEDAEGEHFAKEVWHPGNQAQPFMRPAVDIMRDGEALKLLTEAIGKEMTNAVGGPS